MRCSTSEMLLAAICFGEAVAGPAHAHLHKRAHKAKRDVNWEELNWNDMGIDWTSAYDAGLKDAKTSSAPTATAIAAAVAEAKITAVAAVATTTAVKASTNEDTSSVESAIASLWNGLVGIANDFSVFGTPTVSSGADVSKIGNIGNKQGSNMIKVSSRTGYQFTNEFINTSGETMTVVLWNKAFSSTGNAADALANLGACVAPKTPILTFALAPGASQIVAFQEDTQMGFAQATSQIHASGAFATTIGEVNYLSAGSGYDRSAILDAKGNTYNMSISSLESSCVSDMNNNYWLTDTQPIGDSDGSCFISQSTASLTTHMGGYVS